jgi:hypothetical protein
MLIAMLDWDDVSKTDADGEFLDDVSLEYGASGCDDMTYRYLINVRVV